MARKARRKKGRWSENLETYAFWTGFASTLISLIQVLIIALRN